MVDRGVLDGVLDVLDFWKLKHGISRPTSNLQKVRQEPSVLQGSNLEMVDRGLLDGLPDILDT